ncbi:MAG: SlyX family protein [Zetaproteobacteria bacterium]|nr:MAG: SlyX family protein [Zetaproteobacteria bacterium]
MDERLIELETRLAYQERAIEELNQALTGQQRQLDQLLLRLKRIETHLQQGGEPIARPNEEPPPPHY